jgi:outer membrane protein OmpA-like peptidoglycan-associated protein
MILVVCLAGCTTDPYTGKKELSKTGWGSILGAAGGAAIGAATGDDSKERQKNALIGAGIGALAGGAVGNYMDRQEAKIRQQLQGTGVSVTRVGNDLILNMPGNITFATNSSDINSGFYNVLNSVVLVLKEYEKTMIEISGHTDSVGEDAYNLSLSQRRAASVGQYLITSGIMNQRVMTQGFGESRPIASNDTEQGRQQNRRVELRIIPLTQ